MDLLDVVIGMLRLHRWLTSMISCRVMLRVASRRILAKLISGTLVMSPEHPEGRTAVRRWYMWLKLLRAVFGWARIVWMIVLLSYGRGVMGMLWR